LHSCTVIIFSSQQRGVQRTECLAGLKRALYSVIIAYTVKLYEI